MSILLPPSILPPNSSGPILWPHTRQHGKISQSLQISQMYTQGVFYTSISCNHYEPLTPPPPLILTFFLHWLLASITAMSNTLFNTSVVYPIFNYFLKIVLSPTSTPSGIKTTTLYCSSLDASLKLYSKYCIPILSTSFLWNTQPSNWISSYTNTYIHIPTHLLTSIT